MVLLSHAVVGAAIGVAVKNSLWSFLIGILSHHLMDSFPHIDYGSRLIKESGPRFLGQKPKLKPDSPRKFDETFWKILFVDFSVAWTVFLWIFYRLPENLWLSVFFGALGALLPDVIAFYPPFVKAATRKYKWAAFIAEIHSVFHWALPIKSLFWGFFWQIAFTASALGYIARFIR